MPSLISPKKRKRFIEEARRRAKEKQKKGSPAKAFLEEIEKEIVEVYKQGLTLNDIVDLIGTNFEKKVSIVTLRNFLKEKGYSRGKGNRRQKPIEVTEAET